jgi:hypothetical protein
MHDNMDRNDMHLEDMLFGFDTLHDSYEDAGSDNSDDEMLEDVDDEDPNLWNLDDDSLLMPDHEVEQHSDFTATQPQHCRKEASALNMIEPVRDRYCIELLICLMC